jgi:DNA-binding transcriptional ArsR family regulator
MSLPAVSKHLKVLERAGLVARGRHAQWRPCRLDAKPLKRVATGSSATAASGRSSSIGWTTISANYTR